MGAERALLPGGVSVVHVVAGLPVAALGASFLGVFDEGYTVYRESPGGSAAPERQRDQQRGTGCCRSVQDQQHVRYRLRNIAISPGPFATAARQ